MKTSKTKPTSSLKDKGLPVVGGTSLTVDFRDCWWGRDEKTGEIFLDLRQYTILSTHNSDITSAI